jgi:hypothetical protein
VSGQAERPSADGKPNVGARVTLQTGSSGAPTCAFSSGFQSISHVNVNGHQSAAGSTGHYEAGGVWEMHVARVEGMSEVQWGWAMCACCASRQLIGARQLAASAVAAAPTQLRPGGPRARPRPRHAQAQAQAGLAQSDEAWRRRECACMLVSASVLYSECVSVSSSSESRVVRRSDAACQRQRCLRRAEPVREMREAVVGACVAVFYIIYLQSYAHRKRIAAQHR